MLARESEWFSQIYGYPRNEEGTTEPASGNTYFFFEEAISNYRGASGRRKYIGTVIGTTYNGDHIGNTEGMLYGKYKLFLNEYAPSGIQDNDPIIKIRNWEGGMRGRVQYYEPGDTITYDPEINGGIGAILIPNYVPPQPNRRIGTRRFPVMTTPAAFLAQARVVAPIPANRPYRDGESVEVEINGNWVNGTFRGHASRSVNDHGFIVDVNGGEQYFEPNRVRRPGGQPIIDSEEEVPAPAVPAPAAPPAQAAPPIPPVGLPAENRRALFPPRRREPSAALVAARAAREETRLAAEAARVRYNARAREPANAPANIEPMPPPPPAPEGVAYEIHNAFDNFKLNKFMEIIRREITNKPPSAGILPLFENPDNILYPIIAYTFKQTGLTQEAKEEKISQLSLIQRTIESYEGFTRNKPKIIEVLKFVMTQPREFIEAYIQTLLTDCLKAYSTGRQESCIKGMYERIFFSIRDAIATMCLDQMQGTGPAPLCKPSYIELFECFYEVWPKEGPGGLNEMMQEWYGDGEEVSALSPENRIESFMNFVRNKINNPARFRQAEASIRKYANEDLNAMFGGKKRQRRSSKRSVKRTKRIKRSKKTMKRRR